MMRRDHLRFFGVLLLVCGSVTASSAAEFDTGIVRVLLNDYGRVRLALSAPDSNVQLDRLSLLAGVGPTEVFDCIEDAGPVEPAVEVPSPLQSDFELRGVVDNRNSAEPPEVTVRQYLYGWSNTGYALGKFVLINSDDDTMTVRIGSEILPQIGGLYGGESVEWSAETEVITIHKTSDYVGVRFLNNPLVSLCFFDWYSGYNAPDENLWAWLNYDQFDSLFTAGGEGSVIIPSCDFMTLSPGDSTATWLAVAYGNTENEMQDNIEAAQDAYNFLAVDPEWSQSIDPATFRCSVYPNPFNQTTVLRFDLPQAAEVKLDVFDINGRLIRSDRGRRSTAGNFFPGNHAITFDGSGLPSGVYIYRLKAGGYVTSGKMVLLK
jgi:hypothetical protein